MNKKVIGGILAGVAVAAGVVCSVIDYQTTMYQCKECKTLHKPTPFKWAMGMHTLGKRLLKCPHCGDTGWHDKFVVADELDFM